MCTEWLNLSQIPLRCPAPLFPSPLSPLFLPSRIISLSPCSYFTFLIARSRRNSHIAEYLVRLSSRNEILFILSRLNSPVEVDGWISYGWRVRQRITIAPGSAWPICRETKRLLLHSMNNCENNVVNLNLWLVYWSFDLWFVLLEKQNHSISEVNHRLWSLKNCTIISWKITDRTRSTSLLNHSRRQLIADRNEWPNHMYNNSSLSFSTRRYDEFRNYWEVINLLSVSPISF